MNYQNKLEYDMLSAIKRLQSLNQGFHALQWNQLVTKKKWLFIEETIVEPTVIGYVHILSYETRTNSNLIATIYNDQCQRLGEICVRNGEIVYVSVDISGDLKHVSESEELVFKSYVEGKVWKADEIKPIDKLPKT